ncbi:MAG TPA: hypothetical protein VJ203_13465 [Bacteroidales bacterium]|nr:hypothetical protein [Bacteroidales bacterium]
MKIPSGTAFYFAAFIFLAESASGKGYNNTNNAEKSEMCWWYE